MWGRIHLLRPGFLSGELKFIPHLLVKLCPRVDADSFHSKPLSVPLSPHFITQRLKQSLSLEKKCVLVGSWSPCCSFIVGFNLSTPPPPWTRWSGSPQSAVYDFLRSSLSFLLSRHRWHRYLFPLLPPRRGLSTTSLTGLKHYGVININRRMR